MFDGDEWFARIAHSFHLTNVAHGSNRRRMTRREKKLWRKLKTRDDDSNEGWHRVTLQEIPDTVVSSNSSVAVVSNPAIVPNARVESVSTPISIPAYSVAVVGPSDISSTNSLMISGSVSLPAIAGLSNIPSVNS